MTEKEQPERVKDSEERIQHLEKLLVEWLENQKKKNRNNKKLSTFFDKA